MLWRNYSQTLFLKKIKIEHISGSIALSLIQFVFILKLRSRILAFTSYKVFLKNLKNYFLKTITRPNIIVWLSLLREILCSMCIAIFFQPGCDIINLKLALSFLIKPFFYMIKKARQKFKCFENKTK